MINIKYPLHLHKIITRGHRLNNFCKNSETYLCFDEAIQN